MKKAISLVFTISIFIGTMVAQGEAGFCFWEQDFVIGQSYELFGNNVKMRTSPNLKSDVVQLIKIKNKVKILEKTDQSDVYKKIKYPWYQVEFEGKKGYVLGSLIAHHQLNSLENKEVSFYFHLTPENQEQEGLLKIKAYNNENLLNTFQFQPIGGGRFNITISDDRGLGNLWDILTIDYWGESCGAEGGLTYIFWDDNKLTHIANLSSVGDGGIYHHSQSFMFPGDTEYPEYLNGSIFYHEEEGEMKDEKTEWYLTQSQARKLTWDGKQILPKDFQGLVKED